MQRRHRFAPLPPREVGDPNEEGNGGYRETDKRDDLDRTRIGERKNRILYHAPSWSAEIDTDHVHGQLGEQEQQIQGHEGENDPGYQHLLLLLNQQFLHL
jgi:hypothetical protein